VEHRLRGCSLCGWWLLWLCGCRGAGARGSGGKGGGGEEVEGREWREGSGGKGVEEGGREWWGGSGDAGPRCRSSLARVVAVRCWHASLPFFVGVHRCCLPLGGGSSSSVGGALSSVDGGRCCPWGVGRGHGWGIVVVRGRSSFGWGVVVEQGGRRLCARSPSIGGGVVVVRVVSSLSFGESVSVVRIGMGGLTNGQQTRFVVHCLVATSPMATWHLE
jgi:hypothetical protein